MNRPPYGVKGSATTRPPETTAVEHGGMTDHPDAAAEQGRAYSFWFHLQADKLALPDDKLEAEARRHRYIVLNAKHHTLLGTIRSGNPNVQVFVYKDISSTRDYACRDGQDDDHLPTGVGYCYAMARHQDWFLKDEKGDRLKYESYKGHWQMDVGLGDYLTCWADNVVKETKSLGFDGVYLDNALVAADDYHENKVPRKYPTNQSMQNVYANALSYVHRRLRQENLKTAANMANARLHHRVWQRYMEHLDVGVDEWWISLGDSRLPEYPEGWRRQVDEIAHNESNGKVTWVQPHIRKSRLRKRDDRALWYAMASYFMAAGGNTMITEIGETDSHAILPPEREVYTWRLGQPQEAYHEIGKGTCVFRRRFADGMVLVNANKDTRKKVKIEGDYIDMDGKPVPSSVSLPGVTGVVLRAKN